VLRVTRAVTAAAVVAVAEPVVRVTVTEPVVAPAVAVVALAAVAAVPVATEAGVVRVTATEPVVALPATEAVALTARHPLGFVPTELACDGLEGGDGGGVVLRARRSGDAGADRADLLGEALARGAAGVGDLPPAA
jgi:hypothetical protein